VGDLTLDQIAAAVQESASAGTPSAVLDAFEPPTAPRVGGLPLVPVNGRHALLLERLEHPVLKGGDMTLAELYSLAFLFTRPAEECSALIRDGAFGAAVEEWAGTLLPGLGERDGAVLGAHLAKAYETVLKMVPERGGDQKKTAA
jgi:hypothetical protein